MTKYASLSLNEQRNAARWHRMDRAERLAVMAQLAARMNDAGLAPPEMVARSKSD